METGKQHWSLTRAEDGIATLTLDKNGAAVNTLSAEVMAELAQVLDDLDAAAPKGLVIRSGKDNGFISGLTLPCGVAYPPTVSPSCAAAPSCSTASRACRIRRWH